jgi:hypothetical protein
LSDAIDMFLPCRTSQRIIEEERHIHFQLPTCMRQQVFRQQLEIVGEPPKQSHTAKQKCKPDPVLGAATESNLFTVLIRKSEVPKEFSAGQVNGQILKARARVTYGGDLNWEKKGRVYARRIQPTSGSNEGL